MLLTLFIFGYIEENKLEQEVSSFRYVSIDTSSVIYKHQVYVPFNLNKKAKQWEKVLLKVRNTSFTDNIYLSYVHCYDSQGVLLSNIIDSALLIKPMATSEIAVKSNECEKKAII